MTISQRSSASQRWLIVGLTIALFAGAGWLPQTASALTRSSGPPPPGERALSRSRNAGDGSASRLQATEPAAPFASSVVRVSAAAVPFTWRPGCPVGPVPCGSCASAIGVLTAGLTSAGLW